MLKPNFTKLNVVPYKIQCCSQGQNPKAKARTLKAEAEAKAWTLEAKSKTKAWTHQGQGRGRGLDPRYLDQGQKS